MANYAFLVARLSIVSTIDESIDYVEKIKSILPKPDVRYIKGELRKLSTGQWQPFQNKSTQFRYEREFPKINDIDQANQYWTEWITESRSKLNEIKNDYCYKIQLSYEITLKEQSYPTIMYSGEFLKILGDLNIDLTLYFYTES